MGEEGEEGVAIGITLVYFDLANRRAKRELCQKLRTTKLATRLSGGDGCLPSSVRVDAST